MNRKQRKAARRLANESSGVALLEQLAILGPCPTYDDAFTPEQAAPVAVARVEWQRKRAVILDTHRKRTRLVDIEVLQETYWPTVEISVDDPDGKRRARANVTRVRQSEAWRHNNLSGMQRQAESEMQTAWKNRTNGLGIAPSNLNGVHVGASNGTTDESQRSIDLDSSWREFVNETQRERIMLGLVLRVMTEPRTLAELERDFRMRQGSAMFEYARGLDLWAVVRGWQRRA